MGGPVSEVDISGLAKVGGSVAESADGFAKAYTARADVLAAGGALDGWSARAALAAANTAWAAYLKDLAAEIQAFGDGLSASAKRYQATDAAAARQVHAAGRDLAGPGGYGQAPR